jgi:hypothetical protein
VIEVACRLFELATRALIGTTAIKAKATTRVLFIAG